MSLQNFCGYQKADFEFGEFSFLIGPNGIGKTTILNAVSLLCSSLDFNGETESPGGWNTIGPEQRLRAFLKKNIRNIDEECPCDGFRAECVFEHENRRFSVILTENGFEKNELLSHPLWWPGLSYFAKFDMDMVNFQLRHALWPKFKKAYEGITGFEIEPEIYTETDLRDSGEKDADYVIGFYLLKPGGRVHSRKGSAGERKIAKALSSVVNLEESRQPHIVLIDNIEIHAHWKRHLRMADEIKDLFKDKQVIATTHSLTIINEYEPKSDIIDIETAYRKDGT